MRLPRTVTAAPKPGVSAPRSRLPLRLLLVAAVAVAGGGLGLTLGLRGMASDRPATAGSLPALLQQAGPLVVFSEFGEMADAIWAASPDDPTQRMQLGRIEHARGYGIVPKLSPDGGRIAYTLLPPDAPFIGPDVPAELWVLETKSGDARRLVDGIDLLIPPVWSRDGDALVVRESTDPARAVGSSRLLRVDLEGIATKIAEADVALFPIDFSADGARLYYASVSPAGTDLARVPVLGGPPEPVAHLSDGFARDWHLSPDGGRLSYLAQAPADAEIAFVAQVLDLATGTVQTPLGDARVAQFNPVWDADGGLTIGRLDASGAGTPLRLPGDGAGEAAAVPVAGPTAGPGFDVPLSWSPERSYLVVRRFEGTSASAAGPSHVELVSSDGAASQLSPLSDVAVAGWLEELP